MINIEKLRQELTSDERPSAAKPRQSKKGVMRELYPAICEKLDKGWRHVDVAAWLTEKGIAMSVNMFSVYLYQLDTEHGRSRLAELTGTSSESQQPAQQPTRQETAAQPPKRPARPPGEEKGKGIEKPKDTARTAEFPTSETAQTAPTKEPEGGELSWDNLAAELTVEPLDEKGFVQMPGTVKNRSGKERKTRVV